MCDKGVSAKIKKICTKLHMLEALEIKPERPDRDGSDMSREEIVNVLVQGC